MSTRMFLNCLAALGVALIFVSCLSGKGRNAPQEVKSHLPSATPTANSAIRSVDFANIAYPNFPDYSNSNAKHITLKPGEAGPSHVNYGDATGDGVEEAMVVLPVETRGSSIPYHVYIFTMENGKPKVMWDFDAGDRADGGLRQVYAEGGELVVELYGKDRVVGGQLYRGEEGLCCPSSFTRTRYRWTGKRFEQTSNEVLGNPSGDAIPVMPQYAPKN